jgi:LacI family transcriptional regulator
VPVTIHDVAKQAGVSIKTVSRVVNKEPYVRESTRKIVLEAMTRLGYTPNISARRLASERSFMIGLISQEVVDDQYFSSILHTAITLGLQKGYSSLVIPFTPFAAESRARVQRLIAQKQIDGFILTPPSDNDLDFLALLQNHQIPFVRLTPYNPSLPLPYVAADEWIGAYQMTEYLIQLGHTQFGFVYGARNHQASHDRFMGFRAALEKHQVPFNPDWVADGDFSFERGITAGTQLLTKSPRPTAIFASNDESAAGVLIAAHELDIPVPEQLSVVGVDDFPVAQRTWPPLTTVRQPMDEITRQALIILIGFLNNQAPEVTQVRVPPSLILRKSAGAWKPQVSSS